MMHKNNSTNPKNEEKQQMTPYIWPKFFRQVFVMLFSMWQKDSKGDICIFSYFTVWYLTVIIYISIQKHSIKTSCLQSHCPSILGQNVTGGEQSFIWRKLEEPQLWGRIWRSLWLVPQLRTQLLQLRDELFQSSDIIQQLTVDLTCGHICVHLLEEEGAEEKDGKWNNEINR